MFRMAADIWERRNNSFCGDTGNISTNDLNRKNELQEKFAKCYEHICAIKDWSKKSEHYDSLEVLSDLGDGSRLKQELSDLIENLLAFCSPSDKKSFLVLQIDDTDMNMNQAYKILEDVRKYLIIPNLIVVMAADIDNFQELLYKEFSGYYTNPETDFIISSTMERERLSDIITKQYLLKLFPVSRRIYLPQLDAYLIEHIDLMTMVYKVNSDIVIPTESDKGYDVQEQILRLIYRKTGLIFLKHKDSLHYIIPDNMRMINHFLTMLIQMEDVEEPDGESPLFYCPASADLEEHRQRLRNRQKNIQRFRDYFMNVWISNNLMNDEIDKINGMEKANLTDKMSYLCSILDRESRDIVGYVSYTDMLKKLEAAEIEILNGKREISYKKFIFAVHTFIALLCHGLVIEDLIEYYDGINDIADDAGCSYPRLYNIFGSRVIQHKDMKFENKNYISADIYKTFKTRKSENYIVVWKGDIPGIREQAEYSIAAMGIRMLYSMLFDYYGTNKKTGYQADLCSSIMNCLYLRINETGSEFVRNNMPGLVNYDEKFEVPDASYSERSAAWKNMQSNALTAVLNWDVQNKLSRELQRKEHVKPNKNNYYKKIIPEQILSQYRMFYQDLVQPLKSTSTNKQIISCLDTLQFDDWLKLIISEFTEMKRNYGMIMEKVFNNIYDFDSSESNPDNGQEQTEG